MWRVAKAQDYDRRADKPWTGLSAADGTEHTCACWFTGVYVSGDSDFMAVEILINLQLNKFIFLKNQLCCNIIHLYPTVCPLEVESQLLVWS